MSLLTKMSIWYPEFVFSLLFFGEPKFPTPTDVK